MSQFRFVSELFPGGAVMANLAESVAPSTIGTRATRNRESCHRQCRNNLKCHTKCVRQSVAAAMAGGTVHETRESCMAECDRKKGAAKTACKGRCRALEILAPATIKSIEGVTASANDVNDVNADANAGGITSYIGLNVLVMIMFVVAVIVAAVYTFRFNAILGDSAALGRAAPKALKMCADIMVPTWLFIMTPFVNIGMAGGLAVSVANLQKQLK